MDRSLYSIREQLAAGAHGTIFVGVDLHANQLVAIKVFNLSKATSKRAFRMELFIHIIMVEKGKRICEALEFYEKPEHKGYMVMKKYPQDLFDLAFDQEKKLTIREIRKIFKRICRGVRDLHQKGVAHLDLKPENVLLDEQNKPVLCDFGGSYACNGDYKDPDHYPTRYPKSKRANCRIKFHGRGTKAYSAPEVDGLDDFNPFSADIYSLGIILFTLLTGGFPFPIENSHDLYLLPAESKIGTLGFLLLSSMLSFDPAERPSIEYVVDQACQIKDKSSRKK